MSDVQSTVREQTKRLIGLWPRLKSNPSHAQEIDSALMRNAKRLVPDDVVRGFDLVIEHTPTSEWAPGPSEVLGCVLQCARDRREKEGETPLPEIPRQEAVGRRCQKCRGTVEMLPAERVLYCATCNRTMMIGRDVAGPRWHLSRGEMEEMSTRRVGEAGSLDDAREVLQRIRARVEEKPTKDRRGGDLVRILAANETADASSSPPQSTGGASVALQVLDHSGVDVVPVQGRALDSVAVDDSDEIDFGEAA